MPRGRARTNNDIPEALIRRVRERYRLRTQREAVQEALRRLAGETMSTEEALALRGSGWEGVLDTMRQDRMDVR